MNKQHDHDRIAAMIRTGFPAAIIARRLGCSPKTVHRVAAARRLRVAPLAEKGVIGTSAETLLWDYDYDALGHTPARIAYDFGRSRQLVSRYFSEPRQTDSTSIFARLDEAADELS